MGAMMAAWQPDWTASMRRGEGHRRLAAPTSPWSSRFIGSGRAHVPARSRRAPAPGRRSARTAARRAPPRAAAGDASKAMPGSRLHPAPPQRQRQLQEEELVEGQPPEGRVARAAARPASVPGGGKWACCSASPAAQQAAPLPGTGAGRSSTPERRVLVAEPLHQLAQRRVLRVGSDPG